MSFKTINLSTSSAKTRYVTGVTSFSGLDASTQRFKISSNRAIDIKNFIYKDGVIQKREGVEELYNLNNNPTYYIPVDFTNGVTSNREYKKNTTNFNGMWTVTGEDGVLHIIAHVGKLLYEIIDFGKSTMKFEVIEYQTDTYVYAGNTYHYCYEFEDYKSSAFVGANRLYFLGGNKFVCIKWTPSRKLFLIEDNKEETYIPTTTTSITYKNSMISGRASLDKVNLMTQWRINELTSGTLKSEDEKTKTYYYDYTLDAPLVCKKQSDMADILITLEEGGTIQ